MSRSERDISHLKRLLDQVSDEVNRYRAKAFADKLIRDKVLKEHPDCPKCQILAQELEKARDTIDFMAFEQSNKPSSCNP